VEEAEEDLDLEEEAPVDLVDMVHLVVKAEVDQEVQVVQVVQEAQEVQEEIIHKAWDVVALEDQVDQVDLAWVEEDQVGQADQDHKVDIQVWEEVVQDLEDQVDQDRKEAQEVNKLQVVQEHYLEIQIPLVEDDESDILSGRKISIST